MGWRFHVEGVAKVSHQGIFSIGPISGFLGSLWLLVSSPQLGLMKNTSSMSLHPYQCSPSMLHQCKKVGPFILTWTSFLIVAYLMRILKIFSESSVHRVYCTTFSLHHLYKSSVTNIWYCLALVCLYCFVGLCLHQRFCDIGFATWSKSQVLFQPT